MKLTSYQIWNMAQNVATKLHYSELTNISKDELVKIDSRCARLIDAPSQDDDCYDENRTLDYFKTLVRFHIAAKEAGYKVEQDGQDKEMMVHNIVNDYLEKDGLDDHEIKDVLLDDYGQCIHVSFTGAICAQTIIDIGKEFGDDSPNVYSKPGEVLKIVFTNNNHKELLSIDD